MIIVLEIRIGIHSVGTPIQCVVPSMKFISTVISPLISALLAHHCKLQLQIIQQPCAGQTYKYMRNIETSHMFISLILLQRVHDIAQDINRLHTGL